ncbi:MAG: fructosamine kinase family protein, partial [Cyanobacteriota bacterium]|nr:fructosamine kinase family protein [Cyanobacteriota bacterium]
MNERLRKGLVAAEGPLSGEVIKAVECVAGGCIHQAWCLQLKGGRQLFAKTGGVDALPMLKVEVEGLKALKAWVDPGVLEVPEPLAFDQVCGEAVLLLPWLDFWAGNQASLGRGLALLHRASAAENPGRFGWPVDGFIGAGSQPGGWREEWGDAFVTLRLRPQLREAARWGLDLVDVEPILAALIPWLDRHQPIPSLVHGDLWSGNANVLSDGRGVLLDPATWWADREVDLAMTQLFGGFSKDFYIGYENVWPLP